MMGAKEPDIGPIRDAGPIEVRRGGDTYRYYVAGDSFFTEWKSGWNVSKYSWPLQGMSPALGKTAGRSPGTTRAVRRSLLLIASAVVVFFSDYNSAIPLLAPFLLILGVLPLTAVLRQLVPYTWTEVRKSNGETAFTVIQPKERTPEWTQFEADLAAAIRAANGPGTST